jgi:hypothetical protein
MTEEPLPSPDAAAELIERERRVRRSEAIKIAERARVEWAQSNFSSWYRMSDEEWHAIFDALKDIKLS